MTELLRRTRSEVRDFVDVSHVQVNTATKEQVKLVTVKLVKLRRKLKSSVKGTVSNLSPTASYWLLSKDRNTVQFLFPTKFYVLIKRNILRTRL